MKQKRINFLLVAFFLMLISSCDNKPKIDNLIITFFDNYEKEGVDKAIDYLYLTNKWADTQDSSFTELKNQLKNTIPELGEYYGYELITTKQIGNPYILYSVLVKYERQPLRFTFILYNPNDKTSFQNFTFETDFDDELVKAAEVYFLEENY